MPNDLSRVNAGVSDNAGLKSSLCLIVSLIKMLSVSSEVVCHLRKKEQEHNFRKPSL